MIRTVLLNILHVFYSVSVDLYRLLFLFTFIFMIAYMIEHLWFPLVQMQPSQLPNPSNVLLQQGLIASAIQTTFLHQQLNLLIEMIAFRLKNLSFTHRTTFLYFLNNLFSSQQQTPISYIKHPQIYLKLIF